MSIGNKIKNRRKELGLTQIELGQLVHKSSQVISNWERGYTTGISFEDIQLLAKALATNISYFVPNTAITTSKLLINNNMFSNQIQVPPQDSRLNSLIAEYPYLDEKSKEIIDAIVTLAKNT